MAATYKIGDKGYRGMHRHTPTSATIIVVDDDLLMRNLLNSRLERDGYKVVALGEGSHVVAACAEYKPDLVILDVLLPDTDGFTVCRQLRDAGEAPVLMVTGLNDTASIDLAFESGALDVINKPIHWPVFRQRVRRIIESYRQAQELALLDRVRSVVAQHIDITAVMHAIVEGIAETFGYTHVSLYTVRGSALVLQHQVGYETVLDNISISTGVMGQVVQTGVPILLSDVRAEPMFLSAIDGITSEICVPLWDGTRVMDVLNVESTGGQVLTDADLRLMVALSQNISIAVTNARLYSELQQKEERYRTLIATLDEGVVLQSRDGRILACNISAARILDFDPDGAIGQIAILPNTTLITREGEPFTADTTPTAFALITGQPQTGVVMGVVRPQMTTQWLSVNSHPLFDGSIPEPYAAVTSFSDITERIQAEALLERHAFYDALTGLPNRLMFQQRLDQNLLHEESLALLFVDLDGFKQVNDTYGHDAGDVVLRAVSVRMLGCVRKGDIVARLGGDEFVILLPDATATSAAEVAERLLIALATPIIMNVNSVRVGASIGISIYPANGNSATTLLKNADDAMYKAKQAGKNTFRFTTSLGT